MTSPFLTPAALGLTALLAVVALLHMLRLRREAQHVPSTLLWRTVVQDPAANSLWQPLRRNLLLLLQLLFLALLVLALARPFVTTRRVTGRHLVLLVDRSATMAATDVTPSRIEAAKRSAAELVRSAGGAQLTLLAFDQGVEVLAAGETDSARVEQALAGLQAVPVPGDATDALAFAAALAEGQADSQVVLLSDGVFAVTPDTRLAAPLTYERVGASDDDQAISALSLGAGQAGGPPSLFVQVANLAGRPASRRVEVRVDGTLYDARDLSLPPGGRDAFTVALPDDVAVAEARLVGRDALALDDAAWAVGPRDAQARVTLLSPGNRFLETALTLNPRVQAVTAITETGLAGPFGLTDVTVLDGLSPLEPPPGGLLVVAPVTDTVGVRVLGDLANPVPRLAAADHPLAAGLDLTDVRVLSSQALELGPGWEPVVTAEVDGRAWPLVAAGRLWGRPAVLVAFDLRQSDLPLAPAFPVLMANALDWLAPSALAGVPTAAAPMAAVPLRFGPAVTAVRVTDPAGRTSPLALSDGRATLAGTRDVGIYQVEVTTAEGRAVAPLAVSYFPQPGATIRPADDLALGGDGGLAAPGGAIHGRRELWWPLALAALAVLMAEWLWDHRLTLRRLRQATGPGRGQVRAGAGQRREAGSLGPNASQSGLHRFQQPAEAGLAQYEPWASAHGRRPRGKRRWLAVALRLGRPTQPGGGRPRWRWGLRRT